MRKLIIFISIFNVLMAQGLVPGTFKINVSEFDTSAYKGLKSNMISDIVPQEDTLVWLGTGSGLAVLRDTINMYTITSKADASAGQLTNVTPTGGVVALAVHKKTLFAAFAKSGEDITVGNGLIYSTDATGNSIDYTYFDQPVDTEADSLAPFAKRFFKGLPITVKEANVTYDAAISGNYIWITSWAGGLRRYNILQKVWERVPLPMDGDQVLNTCEAASYENTSSGYVLKNYYLNPRDPWDGTSTKSEDPKTYGNHNHKAFSVMAYGDTVWVGTANGINRGLIGDNGCVNWIHYTPVNDGLSGGFVVGLARQVTQGQSVIWAATVTAGAGEKSGVSFSNDDGDTWHTTLSGERVYNITTFDSTVLVASKSGLWKTVTENPMDVAKPWARYKPAKQALLIGSTGTYAMDEILSDEVIGVAYDQRPFYSSSATVWIGSWDGLARALDPNGSNWKVYRATYDSDKVYAYPNPFSPYEHNQMGGDGYVHIHANVKTSFVVKMDIFNFAMEPVLQKQFDRRISSTGSLKWNGKDKNGRLVDNGTYFIRLEFDQKVKWIKLIVVK
ncbi:MAG: hypothetical protein OXR70_08330 [Candidatus Marinimicrobia bacterium]|nr:hypothetical protein [Candidatus Neomarinimicrobiota bacterium]MDD9887737.1 hypothetical protein [Candidatus Neomarinimicrobiota bacterium]MDD9931856.1 hypothetical protein [Candidatus Neomarinimicrobiota bacterium]